MTPILNPSSTMPTSAQDKKEKTPENDIYQHEAQDLQTLLSLVSTPTGKQQLPSLENEASDVRKSLQWPTPLPKDRAPKQQCKEAAAMDNFSKVFHKERHFTTHRHKQVFSEIFIALVKQRLSNTEWSEHAPSENILRLLVCLRIMLRDQKLQKTFDQLNGTKILSEYLRKAADSYLTYGDGPFVVDILKEMTNIFQKLSTVIEQRDVIVRCNAHRSLVLLLSANDVIVLHCSMHALIGLAQSEISKSAIAELNCIEILLTILQDYDILSKKMAGNLLRLLCSNSAAREMVKVYDGIPLLLSLLHSDNVKLLWNVVWCLVQLSEDQDTSNDIRQMGGIPLFLSLLHDRKFVSDRASTSSTPLKSPAVVLEEDIWNYVHPVHVPKSDNQTEEQQELLLSLKSAACAGLTELIVNDTNAQQIVQNNGIFLIGLLILPDPKPIKKKKAEEMLQANAFRALRFLFSMERNRRLFKRLFPPELFEKFIDIGHYKVDLSAYHRLVQKLNNLPEEVINEIEDKLNSTNQNKSPSQHIGDYAVLELLGSGAFGSVYKVKKKTAGQSYLAMKEINTLMPTMGKNTKEREKSVGDVVHELNIIKEQLKHPNVVRYYKTFVECDKLYIVMELIEGAPLYDHFNSLKEKGEKFSEERVWNIFIQMVLALRYLHKEKGIVHRDLTPNNIMLGEGDKVTITDFGLAKQKQKDCSKMTSVVGTILYSCPEIVQSQPYGEKADIWAIGCIFYQMCTLNPPFYSNNMLSLATKIVGADYEPLPTGAYSEKVSETIRKCITADPEERPDVVQVAAHIADVMLLHMDSMRRDQINMEKKLERERRRTQKHFTEASTNMEKYHKLFLVSQERYDKLNNLCSSGGGQSLKDESDLSDSMFSDQESVCLRNTSCGASSNGTVTENEDQNNNENASWASDSDLDGQCSSGNESREGSAGNERRNTFRERMDSGNGVIPRPPEGTPKGRRKPKNLEQLSQALTLDIPFKNSRDSGISSGDPSPNTNSPSSANSSSSFSSPGVDGRPRSLQGFQRSMSSPAVEVYKRLSSGRSRPTSANTATLTISKSKVSEITDPIAQMLHQLHKIIHISGLPPTLCPNHRRRVIERFKRALFGPQSNMHNLKNELQKLMTGSRELIDLNFGPCESPSLAKQVSMEQEALQMKSSSKQGVVYDTEAGGDVGITYEQLQSIIESVLVETGYYTMDQKSRQRTLPLSPIIGNRDFSHGPSQLKSA